jgi:hypothetical protein
MCARRSPHGEKRAVFLVILSQRIAVLVTPRVQHMRDCRGNKQAAGVMHDNAATHCD